MNQMRQCRYRDNSGRCRNLFEVRRFTQLYCPVHSQASKQREKRERAKLRPQGPKPVVEEPDLLAIRASVAELDERFPWLRGAERM